jgi:hypothetical protein
MRILTGQGIGDSAWTMFKAQGIAHQYGDGIVDIRTMIWFDTPAELRGVEFLSRFDFVRSSKVARMPRNTGSAGPSLLPGAPTDERGRYRYLPDGPTTLIPEGGFVALPNAALENGIRLENWLPEVPIDWTVFDRYRFTPAEERGALEFRARLGRFAVLFMGGTESNGEVAGHNRGGLWRPEDWAVVGEELHTRHGLEIVVVGADYDRGYFEEQVRPLLSDRTYWHDHIGTWSSPCETLAIIRQAQLVVSYQSGMGIIPHYLGVPVAIFWRPEGDSISSEQYLSFDERMAHAWAYPDWRHSGKLLPAIYGRHGVDDVLTWAADWG